MILGLPHPMIRDHMDLTIARCLTNITLQLNSVLEKGLSRYDGLGPIDLHIDRSMELLSSNSRHRAFPIRNSSYTLSPNLLDLLLLIGTMSSTQGINGPDLIGRTSNRSMTLIHSEESHQEFTTN